MGRTAAGEGRQVRELTDEQSWELFDEAARYYLGMGGEAFIESWESGEFEDPDDPAIMSVLMLLPFAQER
jgi:hypothetical protein